jgi:hypothetical protein
MKLNPQDWRKLRTPLIGMGVALMLMVLLVAFAAQRKQQAHSQLETQKNQLNQAHQRYQTSGMEKETIVKYLPRYQQLINHGFIGEERRIEWVDDLRTIHQQNKLFGINYSIGAQEQYKPAFTLNTGPFTLHRSIMKIELSMLHEGDLLTMIDALLARDATPFIPRECVITRVVNDSKNKLAPNLMASCELDWITISEPQAVGAKPL